MTKPSIEQDFLKASSLLKKGNILDAENIDAGPLARAMLDHRVPFGFHGNWRSAH